MRIRGGLGALAALAMSTNAGAQASYGDYVPYPPAMPAEEIHEGWVKGADGLGHLPFNQAHDMRNCIVRSAAPGKDVFVNKCGVTVSVMAFYGTPPFAHFYGSPISANSPYPNYYDTDQGYIYLFCSNGYEQDGHSAWCN